MDCAFRKDKGEQATQTSAKTKSVGAQVSPHFSTITCAAIGRGASLEGTQPSPEEVATGTEGPSAPRAEAPGRTPRVPRREGPSSGGKSRGPAAAPGEIQCMTIPQGRSSYCRMLCPWSTKTGPAGCSESWSERYEKKNDKDVIFRLKGNRGIKRARFTHIIYTLHKNPGSAQFMHVYSFGCEIGTLIERFARVLE